MSAIPFRICRAFLLVSLSALLFSASCHRIPDIKAGIQLSIAHEVDAQPLMTDSIAYQNEAGNPYSVTRLEYYLSDFKFIRADGSFEEIELTHYCNPRKAESLNMDMELPEGSYIGLEFLLGIPADRNLSYTLPATSENINMAWPENMGGGYHFMKLEGHFIDDQGKEKGFAMHLGMNQWLVHIRLDRNMEFKGDQNPVRLSMNINEWFRNPHTYDFNVQGNYTMGIDSLMGKLSENGRDVFTLTNP